MHGAIMAKTPQKEDTIGGGITFKPAINVMDGDPLTNSSGARKRLTKSIIDL